MPLLSGWFLLRAPQRLARRTECAVTTGPHPFYAMASVDCNEDTQHLSKSPCFVCDVRTLSSFRAPCCSTGLGLAPAAEQTANLICQASGVLVLANTQ